MAEPAYIVTFDSETTGEEKSSSFSEIAIGIDIGTSQCSVAMWSGSGVELLKSSGVRPGPRLPVNIAYSRLAHLGPQYGLYSSFVPPLIYAVMGSSRDIAIGPVAVVSLLLGTLLSKEIDPIIKCGRI